jgi:hypothetical protein
MTAQWHGDVDRGLPALGSNLAALVQAMATMAGASAHVGVSIARGVAGNWLGIAPAQPWRSGRAMPPSRCAGGIVRHHYRYCCIPPCPGCRRCG